MKTKLTSTKGEIQVVDISEGFSGGIDINIPSVKIDDKNHIINSLKRIEEALRQLKKDGTYTYK